MPVVILQVPEIESELTSRPVHCPNCGSQVLQSWGQSAKQVLDIQQKSTVIHRYRCTDCGKTFRHYPQWIDRSIQSLRLRKMAALAWVLGLSSRDVVETFSELGIDFSRMTVWREGRELAKQLEETQNQGIIKKYVLDRLYLPGISSRFGVVLVIDAGCGKRIVLGTVDEFNPRTVKSWLEQLVKDTGFQVRVAGTDFLTPPAFTTSEVVGILP